MRPWIILLIMLAIVAATFGILYFFGKKAQKEQDESLAQMEAMKQTINMLVIDKKHVKLSESGLPAMVIEEASKKRRARMMKMYVVKAKVGPQIMTFISDKEVYEKIPTKKEVRATISGLYIMDVKSVRAPLNKTKKQLKEEAKKQKKKDSKMDQLLRKGRGEE